MSIWLFDAGLGGWMDPPHAADNDHLRRPMVPCICAGIVASYRPRSIYRVLTDAVMGACSIQKRNFPPLPAVALLPSRRAGSSSFTLPRPRHSVGCSLLAPPPIALGVRLCHDHTCHPAIPACQVRLPDKLDGTAIRASEAPLLLPYSILSCRRADLCALTSAG